MNRATSTPTTPRGKSLGVKILAAGLGVAALAGMSTGVASASTGDFPEITGPASAGYVAAKEARANGQTEYSFEAYRYTLGGFASIHVPGMTCPSGSWLQDAALSPGRIVPHGVEVIEPGGVGVTIPRADLGSRAEKTSLGTYFYLDGTDRAGNATATNWDPFSSRELIINLHCTTNPSKAATEFVPIGMGG